MVYNICVIQLNSKLPLLTQYIHCVTVSVNGLVGRVNIIQTEGN